jgi:hypothetical protein
VFPDRVALVFRRSFREAVGLDPGGDLVIEVVNGHREFDLAAYLQRRAQVQMEC